MSNEKIRLMLNGKEEIKIIQVKDVVSPSKNRIYTGVILEEFTKEESKQLGLFGQLVIYLDLKTKMVKEATYEWEIIESPDDSVVEVAKNILKAYLNN